MKFPRVLLLLFPLAAHAAVLPATPADHVATRRVADLRSFIHGDPPAPPKAPPPKVLATVSFAAGVTPDPQVASFMRAFAAAVKARDGQPLLPRLADDYAIADLPEGHKPADFFLQAIERTPGPDEIVIQAVERQGKVRAARMEFRFPNRVAMKTFKFDAEGRLLASDLFTLKRVDAG